MTIIEQVADAMQDVLTTIAQRLARETNFVQRESKMNGATFVQTLVFTYLADPDASLDELTQTAAALSVDITASGLTQRFTEVAATFLQRVLAVARERVLAADPLAIPILEQFAGVYIEDSTMIVLPAALRDLWHGCGSATDQGEAALKLTLRLDLASGRLAGLSLHDGRLHDSRAAHPVTSLPPESLYLADLGFFRLDRLHQIDAQGGFFLSRLQAQTTVFDAEGRRWDDLAALLARQAASVDLPVTLGVEARLPARLIAVRVPQEVADQRRRRLRAEASRRGQAVSARAMALADWTIFITNAPITRLPIEAVLVVARARWQIEIVFSQVTKADVRTGICRRNNVPDFHLVVGDNHTIDQQFHQLTPLGKAGLLQPNLQPLTDGLDVGDGLPNLQQLLTVVGQLPLLHLQIVALLDQLALPALKLHQLNRLSQIGGQQALALAVETAQGTLDARPAMLQFFGQPLSTVGALQRRGDQVRMLDHHAQILPHQGIQLIGWNPARWTAYVVATGHRPMLAITQVVEIVRRAKAAMALQATLPTADQIAQQVVMPRTALRHLLIGGQPSLDSLKQFLADNRWHLHSNPLLGRGKAPADARTERLERGFAALGRASLYPITIGGAGITGIQEDEADGIGCPVGRTRGRWHRACGQTERELVQAQPTIRIALEQLLDNRCLDGLNRQEGGIARAFGVEAIAIRCAGPREQVTAA